MSAVADRLGALRRTIEAACRDAGRDPGEVAILAVSKRHPAAVVREAAAVGQRLFGENRVQELVAKVTALPDLEVAWHMVGSVQTNKVRALLSGVPDLALLHSLDRVKLADHLQKTLDEMDRELDVLLQVNATGEVDKHGVAPGHAADLLAHVVGSCPRLRPQGLMAMGPLDGDPAPVFARVAALRTELRESHAVALPVLSLGMTGDLAAAVAAGSTMVRIGTGVFGPRPPA